ncbi:MAG TPA: NAD(P)/FAD-dependent oxidoreductase [Gemmatimonadaceae bacterium]|nr:NAD(P)/FAD-dependent oxidoreductase [Gemmatimonadaceae bacterium]
MGPQLDAEVIVVGGGPAGASTAHSLAKQGVDVLVLDRAKFPRDKTCAEYLSPQASRILSDMNVLDEIERSSPAHLSGMRIRAPDGHHCDGEFAANHEFRPFRDYGLAVRRTILDAIVLDGAKAAGARVEEQMRITDVTRDGAGRVSGVSAIGADGAARSLTSRFVVGADGLRSVVGKRLGLTHTSRFFPRRLALVAHYRKVRDVGSLGEMHVDHQGYFGIVHVGGGLMNVAVVVPISRAAEIGDSRAAFLESWIASRPHLAERFAGAERVTDVRATGPFATTSSPAWAAGAALVGDAADFFDPFTGEGMYAALRGGEILAPFVVAALRGAPADENRTLAGYEAARRTEFGGKWKLERIVGMAIAYPYFLNNAAKALSRNKDMADLLVGVAGDFVPVSEVLNPRMLFRLFISPAFES